MKSRAIILLLAVGCALFAIPSGAAPPALIRPASGRGAEATTLLVYAATRAPYSLADDLAALQFSLNRVATRLETRALSQVTTNELASAEYLVVFCPQPSPALTDDFAKVVAERKKPSLWIGCGAEKLELPGISSGQFKISSLPANESSDTVNYRGRDRNFSAQAWLPVELASQTTADVIISIAGPAGEKSGPRPICWKIGAITFLAVPSVGDLNFLLSDLLLDFFEVNVAASACVFVRIDGYHCQRDHREFRRMVDFLYDRGHPFMVGVIPAFWDAAAGKVLELDSQPEFVAALRYAQRRGGRLVMQGYAHTHQGRTGEEAEFWDSQSDRPLPETAEYVRERVHQGLRQMLKYNLAPLAWETPQYAASRATYAELASHFSTAIERVQLSDATAGANFTGSACTLDPSGRFIVPENLGTVSLAPESIKRIQNRARQLSQLRGTVTGGSVPVYLGVEKLAALIGALEGTGAPFLDLAEGDHWVQLPETVLLTGNAERTVALSDAHITWKAFDRGGKLLAEERESGSASGQRTFKRRGMGDYELFQILEARP